MQAMLPKNVRECIPNPLSSPELKPPNTHIRSPGLRPFCSSSRDFLYSEPLVPFQPLFPHALDGDADPCAKKVLDDTCRDWDAGGVLDVDGEHAHSIPNLLMA